MIDLLLMMAVCIFFASIIEKRVCDFPTAHIGMRRDPSSFVIFIIIVVWATLFAALRSSYNDTGTYMQAFGFLNYKEIRFSDLFEPYGGFDVFQRFIKQNITDNPQMMIFISAIISSTLTLNFISKHTPCLTGAVFLFFIGDFIFMMAGIKQSIAMAIALYAVDAYMRRRYIKSIILIFIAILFHPYIICLFSIILLKDNVWSKKTVFTIALFVILFFNLEWVLEVLADITKDYSVDDFKEYTINPIRVIIEAVPIVISFIYRKKLRAVGDPWLSLGINMQIISFTFIFLGLFFNPIYLGRMSAYFSMLEAITIPHMLNVVFHDVENGRLFKIGYYLLFAAFFIFDMTKIGAFSIFYDQFNHVSIKDIF